MPLTGFESSGAKPVPFRKMFSCSFTSTTVDIQVVGLMPVLEKWDECRST
ncbi:hypothetical protein PEC301296_18960 [Pectobacterium carotovorum subsp. carotovorum]|nr:hypothetical protein PEC301296_18960 [Pectobacterium carotovorum subsp. carotovorum]